MNDIRRRAVSQFGVSPEAFPQGGVSRARPRAEGRKGPHQASTSLTPYGMSFWALILAMIEDFDAAGVFNADDFEPLAGVTFAEIQ